MPPATTGSPNAVSWSDPLNAKTPNSWPGRLADNPGVLLSLGYLVVSLLGLAFSWALLREFGLNVFSFADVTDFLMAAFREPMTFVLAASALGVGVLMHLLAGWEIRWLERRKPGSRITRSILAGERAMKRYGVYTIGGFLLYSLAFILLYADRQADAIRAGQGEKVVVHSGDAAPVSGLLLGATSRFVFFYRTDTGQAEAIPQENILRIRPVTGPPQP